MARKALVLGGGGITGIAWELGVLKGLGDEGVDLANADLIIGTSAGSVVGTLLLTHDLNELVDEAEKLSDPELGGRFALGGMMMAAPTLARAGHRRRRASIGLSAVRTHPWGGHERVELIRERLGVEEWPEGNLQITATNAITGKVEIFDKHSGADLVSVVTASCAVPFVWPAVTINEVPYLDGGIRSPANADLISDCEIAVVLAPIALPLARYHDIRAQLKRAGVVHHSIIRPDEASRKVIGRRVLDTRRAAESGLVGIEQGQRVAADVAAVWHSED